MEYGLTTFVLKLRRNAVMAAVVLALTFRALLPSGSMIAASQADSGTFEITICSSASPHKVIVSSLLELMPVQDHAPPSHNHDLCGFAATATAALPPLGALPQPTYTRFAAVAQFSVDDLVIVAPPIGPTLGSRAPPLSI
jgi:hypothetical protein